jgi:hypothetical protein
MQLRNEPERPIYSSVCTFCRHVGPFLGEDEVRTCTAFPDGIPDAIWCGQDKHKDPYPGDRDIRFEAHPEVRPEVLERYGLK